MADAMFVSGTSHQLLQLGQALAAPPQPAGQKRKLGEGGQSRPQRQASEEPSPLRSPAGPTSSTKSKGGGGTSVSLMAMIEAGVLQPARDNTTVTYKGVTHTATLQSNGTILFRGTEFTTPSAFSVHVKRLTTPNKQGDDGWHSVHINGTMLHTLRLQYQQQQQQAASTGGAPPGLKRQNSSQALSKQKQQQQRQQQGAAAGQQPAKQVLKLHVKLKPFTGQAAAGTAAAAPQQPAAKPQQQQQQQQAGAKPKASAGPPQGRPGMHWIQCSRCEVWRSVPEASWSAVSSDRAAGGPWFCEDAGWELTQQEPFTPACLADLWAGGD